MVTRQVMFCTDSVCKLQLFYSFIMLFFQIRFALVEQRNISFQVTNLMHTSIILQQYICYIIILNVFRAVPCSSSGGQIVLLQHLVSSLSLNGRTVCRSPLSTGIPYVRLQRVMIPEAVIIQFVLLKMSKVLLETC